MEKMRMETPDLTAQNVEKIAALFPNCVTETTDENGKLKKAINFDLLRQMLSADVVEGDEAYEFTWVGKKAAIVEANKPIRKTLRPCPDESVDWDGTENLYIEGDNLEVLKLLQESYLGKVKMIYIDPPYNTGKDSFIYPDDFSIDDEEFYENIALFDDEGMRLFRNTDSNGRFHSDWCSMMYSRLMLARNLLAEDGFIFISIDDSEASQLRKICDEIFGGSNYENTNYIQVRYAEKTLTADMNYHKQIEQVLVYRKSPKAQPYLQPIPYDYDKFVYRIEELVPGEEIELGGKKVELFRDGQYRIVKMDEGTKDGLKEIWATGTILNGNSSGRFFRDYLSGRKDIDGLGVLYKVYDIGDDQYEYRYFSGPKKETASKGKYYQGVPAEKMEAGAVKTTPIPNFYDMAGDFGNIRRKPKNKERLFNFSGTKEYMAPETLENSGFDEKVDEWAAGIIMYNMLTGADPFSSDSDSEYKDNIKFKEIKFEYIKNEKLRNLNKKLLNRYMAKRISAKEALDEIINIKNEMIYNNMNNFNKNKNVNKFIMENNKFPIKNCE